MKYNIDLVVLVDCWPSDHPDMETVSQERYYKQLIDKLSTLNFKNVALATYTGGTKDNYEHTETDPYIIEHLQSKNMGADVIAKRCTTFKDVFYEFPELHLCDHMNILIGGQTWWHCLHWRPLGFFGWINQGFGVLSHPALVHYETNNNITSHEAFKHDPFIEWEKIEKCEDDLYFANDFAYNFVHGPIPDVNKYFEYIYKES
tara:strand:- start:562 stop:1170 length:609 start_codon:yes stop_codon:yes gene_type:complete